KAGMAEDDQGVVKPQENVEADDAKPIQAAVVEDRGADETAKS
ncbi:uncharacterized protein METZ01_LOCUS448576, partial [marine metagenome]